MLFVRQESGKKHNETNKHYCEILAKRYKKVLSFINQYPSYLVFPAVSYALVNRRTKACSAEPTILEPNYYERGGSKYNHVACFFLQP